MNLFLNVSSIILILVGLALIIIAQTMKSPNHPPVPSFDLKHWKPIWLMKDWFTPKGFKFHLLGWGICLIGILIEIAQNFS